MALCVISEPAKKDLKVICARTAEDNRQYALKTSLSIEAKCYFLAEHPHLKSQQLQLHNLCKSKIGNRIIFYKPIKKGVEIARILQGARNLPKILETSF